MKFLVFITLIVASSSLHASQVDDLATYFNQYNEQSKITINYDDVSQVLSMSVLEVGMSDRKVMESRAVNNKTGTKLRTNRGRKTAFEANRFLFKEVKSTKVADIVVSIRKDLQKLPDYIDLRELGRDEQLAYWLNLYNIGLIEKLVEAYPKYDLEDELEEKNNFLNEKFITLLGKDVSLNDIKYNIVFKNYANNPVVLYGFPVGIIGSPSINAIAFTGENVYKSLGYLAREFVNSNRGTISKDSDTVEVSKYYASTMPFLFNNDEEKLRKHLMDYAKYDIKEPLSVAKKLEFEIEAWTVVNVEGSMRSFGGNISTNNAALLNAVVSNSTVTGAEGSANGIGAVNLGFLAGQIQEQHVDFGRVSPEMADYLKKINSKYKDRKGKVEIKDLNPDDRVGSSN